MHHHVSYDPDLDYVSITFVGNVTTDDLVRCRAEAAAFRSAFAAGPPRPPEGPREPSSDRRFPRATF